jgi:hypothetical protein
MSEQPSIRKLMEQRDALARVEQAAQQRMATFSSPKEKAEADALIKRAFNPQCEFDRKHTIMLVVLTIAPHEVSWRFKVRERIHRLLRRD